MRGVHKLYPILNRRLEHGALFSLLVQRQVAATRRFLRFSLRERLARQNQKFVASRRHRNSCRITRKTHSVYRIFSLSRHQAKEALNYGMFDGFHKSR